MLSKTMSCAVIALSVLNVSAFAQRHDDGHDRPGPQGHEGRNDRSDGPGHGQRPEFRRGGRLPPEYHRSQYVVDDWRGHHLKAPPRGYHWVQNGGDYLLVAITTGIIANIILNH